MKWQSGIREKMWLMVCMLRRIDYLLTRPLDSEELSESTQAPDWEKVCAIRTQAYYLEEHIQTLSSARCMYWTAHEHEAFDTRDRFVAALGKAEELVRDFSEVERDLLALEPALPVCRNWTIGRCKNWSLCPNSHPKELLGPNRLTPVHSNGQFKCWTCRLQMESGQCDLIECPFRHTF